MAKHHARKVGLGEARETNWKGGCRCQGVGKFIQGGGASDSIVWVRKMGPFGVNGKEDRGGAHRVPTNDHREERKAIRRWDMGDARGRRHTRGSRNPVGQDLYRETSGNLVTVGGATSLI